MAKAVKCTTSTSTSSSQMQTSPRQGSYVQRGHTVTTIKETERKTTRNKRGETRVSTKMKTNYYVDGKLVKLNWFDRLRIRFMSIHEKQAFLAQKLLRQERQASRAPK